MLVKITPIHSFTHQAFIWHLLGTKHFWGAKEYSREKWEGLCFDSESLYLFQTVHTPIQKNIPFKEAQYGNSLAIQC